MSVSQIMSINDELVALKKAVACFKFLDDLQHYLNNVNEMIVNCGCDRCVEPCGGNYDDDVELLPTQLVHVPVSQCLLYTWFKNKCIKYKCVVPDDDYDHPKHYPGNFRLSTCLGRALYSGGWDESKVHHRWRYKIKQLSYDVQVQTIYRLMYNMEKLAFPDESDVIESFEDWFRIKGQSLI